MSEIATVASWVRAARSVAVITGAGISAESGVATFRGPAGLWRSFRPEDLATPEAFNRDPELVWDWYRWRREKIASAQPNAGHHVLARLEARGPEFLLLTQNVDGLHARAGSRQLIELHGNIWRARCTKEAGRVFDQSDPTPDVERATPRDVGLDARGGGAPRALKNVERTPPRDDSLEPARGAKPPSARERGWGPASTEKGLLASGGGAPLAIHNDDSLVAAAAGASCPSCGALLRPDVVWFGEALDPATVTRAVAAVERCDVLLLIGTSGVVYPVAGFPLIARGHGARVVEINVEPTPLSDVAHAVLRGPAGTWLPALEAAL